MVSEARALGLKAGTYALVREVRLLCAHKPWVYARTVIPADTLTGSMRRLAYLGSRSLGAVLFAERCLQRGDLEITCLSACDRLFAPVTQGLDPVPHTVWGRRSVFHVRGKPLLVSEFFLPDIGEFPG